MIYTEDFFISRETSPVTEKNTSTKILRPTKSSAAFTFHKYQRMQFHNDNLYKATQKKKKLSSGVPLQVTTLLPLTIKNLPCTNYRFCRTHDYYHTTHCILIQLTMSFQTDIVNNYKIMLHDIFPSLPLLSYISYWKLKFTFVAASSAILHIVKHTNFNVEDASHFLSRNVRQCWLLTGSNGKQVQEQRILKEIQ